jgi:hypothetical protein
MLVQKESEEINRNILSVWEALKIGSQVMQDTYCLGLLQPLMAGYDYLPFSVPSLRPFCLAQMLNDIVTNNRKSIVEFGSGVSTIMIGRLIKKNGLDARLVTVEHDKGWADVLAGILRKEAIDDVIDIIHAPLKPTRLSVENNLWYDVNVLDGQTAGRQFDMVIIDGPTAWQKGTELARFPAVPYVISKLGRRFSIYLDDADRPGETSIQQMWHKNYGLEFKIAGGTLAYFTAGESFYTSPL